MVIICLAIPGKIISVIGDCAVVDYGSEKREARLLDDSFKTGEFVIVANKIVIERVPEKEALESINAWKKALEK